MKQPPHPRSASLFLRDDWRPQIKKDITSARGINPPGRSGDIPASAKYNPINYFEGKTSLPPADEISGQELRAQASTAPHRLPVLGAGYWVLESEGFSISAQHLTPKIEDPAIAGFCRGRAQVRFFEAKSLRKR